MIPYLDCEPRNVLELATEEVLDLSREISEEYVSELDSRGENLVLDPSLITETDRYLQGMAYLACRDRRPLIEEYAVKTATGNVRGLESQSVRAAFEDRYQRAEGDLTVASIQRERAEG